MLERKAPSSRRTGRVSPALATLAALSLVAIACSASGLIQAPGAVAEVEQPPLAAEASAPELDEVPEPVVPEPAVEAATIDPDAEEALLHRIYTETANSVVHIQVTQPVADGLFDIPEHRDVPGFPDEFFQRGQGSGFVLDQAGHIVTNFHVVRDAQVVQVTFFDGLAVRAEVIGTDPDSDLAVLHVDVDPSLLQPVPLGDSDQVFVGQRAIALGNPFGQTWTLTSGIVSAVGRTLRSGTSQFSIPEMIQTDAAINPGNSGGVLLDAAGRVIGVNTLILSDSGTSSGVGFAIPVNIVRQIVPALIETGEYVYPWLGITGTNLSLELIESMDLAITQRGALVTEVIADSPAARAGVLGAAETVTVDGQQLSIGGDLIIAIDGTQVRRIDDLIVHLVKETRPGDTVTLTILRDGEELALEVTLGARPERVG